MANGFIILNRDDWEHTAPEQRDWLIFNTLQAMNTRLEKLEKRTFVDKVSSFAGGVIGGIVGFLGLKVV